MNHTNHEQRLANVWVQAMPTDAIPIPVNDEKTIPDPIVTDSLIHDSSALAPEATTAPQRNSDEWMVLLYDELRSLAHQRMRHQRPDHTLQPTAVLHEAYARIKRRKNHWQSRAHFYYTAAQVMRNVLVDYARKRAALRRGGDQVRVTITHSIRDDGESMTIDEILQLNQALEHLSVEEPEYAQLVLLRYFGELTIKEVAEATCIPVRSVERKLRVARAWLKTRLHRDRNHSDQARISKG